MPHGTAAILRREAFAPLSSPEHDAGGKTQANDAGKAIANPLVYAAAQFLIDLYRRTGNAVKIEAFDVPHEALLSVAAQLDDMGAAHAVKEALLSALKDHVMSRAGSFARAANAKPIYIALQVADGKPDFAFEQGVTEMAAIDARSARVEGASAVNVRLTATGTATTSNIADVDKMFASVKGDKLWIQFEAPTQEELDGLMTQQQVVLTAVGEAMGGAMSAEALKDVLQKLQQEEAATPEIVRLLETLIEMRVVSEAGITPENGARLTELRAQVQTIIEQGIETRTVQPVIALGAVESLKLLVETYHLEPVIPAQPLAVLETKIQIAELTQTLEIISEHPALAMNAEGTESLHALIETIEGAENSALVEILSTLPDQLADLNVPADMAEQASRIADNAIEVIAVATQGDVLPQVVTEIPQIKLDMAAADILEVLQALDTAELLPPEVAALITRMESAGIDIQTLEPQQVADALAGKGEPALREVIQDTVQTLSAPAVQAALPPTTVTAVTTALNAHADMVAVMAVQSTLAELRQVIESGAVPEAHVPLVTQAIEALERGEPLLPAQADGLQPVIDTLDGPVAAHLQQAIVTLGTARIENDVSAPTPVPHTDPAVMEGDTLPDTPQKTDGQIPVAHEAVVEVGHIDSVDTPVPVLVGEGVVLRPDPEQPAPVLKTAVIATPPSRGPAEAPSVPAGHDAPPATTPTPRPVQVADIPVHTPPSNNGPQAATPEKIKFPAVNPALPGNVIRPAALPPVLPAAAVASQITSIATVIKQAAPAGQPLPAKVRVQVESLNAVANTLKALGDGTLPPAQVVTMLTQLDTVAVHVADRPEVAQHIEQIREQVIARTEGGPEALPEEFKNGGRCPGCGGGDCVSCGTAFETSVADGTTPSLLETVNQVEGLDTFVLEETDIIEETADTGGCGTTCKRNCSTCGTAFNESVNTPSLLDTVAKVEGMDSFSLDDMGTGQNPASSPLSQPRLGIAA